MTDDAPGGVVETLLEDARWAEVGLPAIAEAGVRAVLGAVGRDPDRHEVSLLACSDARIASLNAAFRGRAVPTNVLSWPAFAGDVPDPEDEARLFLGDLALAFETCAAEAAAAGVPLAHHASHLVIHGTLHLLGHDHEEGAEADAMERIETKVLASLGIDDPYSR